MIVVSHFWNPWHPDPVALEDFNFGPDVRRLMKMVGAIPMPSTVGGMGSYKKVRVRKALEHAADVLNEGQNVLICPHKTRTQRPR